MHLKLSDILGAVPIVPRQNLLLEIQNLIAQSSKSVVVLDDDPTGTQTVYDVPVLTEWSVDVIAAEFSLETPLFFILTNSRSLYTQDAESLAITIGKNLNDAAAQTGRDFIVISRSDSTLRGHYPIEVDALLHSLGQEDAIRIIAPAFFEGGRYTYRNIHYVLNNDELVPVAETPFAQDKTFGFQASDLKDWIEEKSQGMVKAQDVFSFDIDLLRTSKTEALTEKLKGLPTKSTCIVNALAPYDLENFVLALLQSKRKFLCRTAASFVAAMGGLAPRPLLDPQIITNQSATGGLTVIGSYVPKSSAQLQDLIESGLGCLFELPVDQLLDDMQKLQMMKLAINSVKYLLQEGQDVIIYTSRRLISGANREESLLIGAKISQAITEIIAGLTVQPRYFIAKGGITSSDIATKSLQVKKARVMGQLIPGVPVWKLGSESKFPDMCYIIFPGNVGNNTALTDMIKKLGRSHHE